MDFTLHLSRPAGWPVEFDVRTSATPNPPFRASSGVDYLDASAHMVFPPGTVTGTFSVAIVGDKVREPLGEVFFVVIESPVGAVMAWKPAWFASISMDGGLRDVERQIEEFEGLRVG